MDWIYQLLDALPYALVVGLSFGTSSSNQKSATGLAQYGGGADNANALAPSLVNLAGTQYGNMLNVATPTSNQYGLAPGTEPAVESMVKLAMNDSSGDYGARGFVSPENRAAVAGSAIQNTLPAMLPNIQDYQKYIQQFPFMRTQAAAATLDPSIRALGGTSSGSSNSFGMGLAANAGSSLTYNAGSA